MTEQHRSDLKELQKLDVRIKQAQERIRDFDPLFEEVEEPALILESELGTTKTRLQEMKLEERRLELASEEKRTRQQRLDEKLGSVRNLREEAAVSAELEMVKRSLQSDEQEALTLLDQLRKMEERAAELEEAYAEASQLVEPKRNDLLAQRSEAEETLATLKSERAQFADSMDAGELKIYDAIRAGGRAIAVAELTDDGACGHCFGMVPLQLQNEIRHGGDLIRCEGCGVILTAADPASEADADEPAIPEAEAEADEPGAAEAVGEGEESAEPSTPEGDGSEDGAVSEVPVSADGAGEGPEAAADGHPEDDEDQDRE